MENLLKARLTITGTRPLLWHGFGADAIPLTKREKTGVAGNDPEEWRKTVLSLSDGQLYLPNSYLFGCLRDGARFTKRGRGSLQPLVSSTLQVLEDRIILPDLVLPDPPPTDPSQPIYLDVRSVVNPSTRGRNVRYRVAAAAGWRLTATIEWDKTVLSRGEMEAVAIDAGRLAGIGSGRSIGFGRFRVCSFHVFDEA